MTHEFDRTAFATRLKQARKKAGLRSWSEAAKVAGISAHTLKSYERGEAMPNAEKLFLIARAYDVSIDGLLGMSDDSAPLPEGMVLCDQALLNRFFATTDPSELGAMLNHHPSFLLCMIEVSRGARLRSVAEALNLRDEISAHLHTHAPDALAAWRSRHLDGVSPAQDRSKDT